MDQFTFSLDSPLSPDNACPHCGKNDQWVSHGYVYKGACSDAAKVVGKRIICANRYGKRGCGHTRQLYLADVIPKHHYRLSAVLAFIKAMLGGMLVEQAYLKAINAYAKEARHAWRWVKDFFKQLPVWRTILSKPAEVFVPSGRSEALKRLLPTLERLLMLDDIATYQTHYQRALF